MASIVPQGFKPFAQFIDGVRKARADQYLKLPYSAVLDASAFSEMRAYLLRYYDGVSPAASFADAGGSVFDCIPIEQQFSLREGLNAAAAPPDSPGEGEDARTTPPDQVGNETCPAGTIPVRRLTLQDLCGFPTLDHFFRKGPTT